MPSTHKSQYYNLSQFLDSDKPTWRGDYNSDMEKIDAGIHTAADAAGIAHTAAMQAKDLVDELETTVTRNDQTVATLNTTVNTHTADIASNTSAIQTLSTREASHYSELQGSIASLGDTTQARFQNYLTKGEASSLYATIGANANPHIVILGGPLTSQWGSSFASLTRSTLHKYTTNSTSLANLATVVSNATGDTAYNHDLVEWIIIGGGEQDVENSVSIDGTALRSNLGNLAASFPNASMLIVPFCIENKHDVHNDAYRKTLYDRVNELENVVTSMGIHCAMKSYIWLWKSANFFSSGALTSGGAKEFAGQLYRYMTGEPNDPQYFVQQIGTGDTTHNGMARIEAYVDGPLCTLRWVYSHYGATIAPNSWLYTLGPSIRPAETFFTRAYLPLVGAERFMRVQDDGQVYMVNSQTTAGAGYSYMNLTYRLI